VSTILFVPVSVAPDKLATDWAEDCDEIILRRCPVCERDSIVGHGRRRKQAHDEHHDWIWIHRGRCADCGKTFTFLPLFSLPYTQYSLLARCEALRLRVVEHCPWEKALPKLKDADRLPDPSTVRRLSSGLCSSLADAQSSGRWRSGAIALDHSGSAKPLAFASLREKLFPHHPCLGLPVSPTYAGFRRRKKRCGRRRRNTQAAAAASGLSAAT
jgi:hypothetical protein